MTPAGRRDRLRPSHRCNRSEHNALRDTDARTRLSDATASGRSSVSLRQAWTAGEPLSPPLRHSRGRLSCLSADDDLVRVEDVPQQATDSPRARVVRSAAAARLRLCRCCWATCKSAATKNWPSPDRDPKPPCGGQRAASSLTVDLEFHRPQQL